VNDRNVSQNFGMRPDSFDRTAFEAWTATIPGGLPGGLGWFMPSMHHRETFLAVGGVDISRGSFPDPLDEDYWNKWKSAGRHVRRVSSYSYHLQNWSNPVEQAKEIRHK